MAHIEELQLLMSPPAHIHTLFPHPRADQAQPRLETTEDFICSPKKNKIKKRADCDLLQPESFPKLELLFEKKNNYEIFEFN